MRKKPEINFHIVTLFPSAFSSYINESILKRAIDDGKISVSFYNPRDFVTTKQPGSKQRKEVDDRPYGGGPGMVMRALPVIRAIEKAKGRKKKVKIIFLQPDGQQFTNEYAHKIAAKHKDIIIVCGRYEGIDARVKDVFQTDDVSIGPFVLTGGELPAMIIVDVVSRQVKGVLGDFTSLEETRVASPDVYTRPDEFVYKKKKYRVPDILLTGHHKHIDEWRQGRKGS